MESNAQRGANRDPAASRRTITDLISGAGQRDPISKFSHSCNIEVAPDTLVWAHSGHSNGITKCAKYTQIESLLVRLQ